VQPASFHWIIQYPHWVTLPWPLHKFAEGVQMIIANRGQVLLEKR
jgi:hypothetical protein